MYELSEQDSKKCHDALSLLAHCHKVTSPGFPSGPIQISLTQYCISFGILVSTYIKTSLLRRLQEQTLPDEAPPMGKIHHSAKLP